MNKGVRSIEHRQSASDNWCLVLKPLSIAVESSGRVFIESRESDVDSDAHHALARSRQDGWHGASVSGTLGTNLSFEWRWLEAPATLLCALPRHEEEFALQHSR